MIYLKAFAGTLLSFLIIDAVWIAFVVRGYYESTVGDIMRSSPRGAPVILFYIAYAAGVVFLAVRPAMTSGSVQSALLNGAVVGALAYGTYTVTNYAILRNWTWGLVASDILWGAFLTAAAAACGLFAAKL